MVLIFDDLADLNIPIYAEGDAPENLPDNYFTYSEDYTADNLNADNKTKEIRYEFTLKYYTKNAETLYSGLTAAMELLKSKGYIISGVGYANKTYRDTWFSRMADIKKIEYMED